MSKIERFIKRNWYKIAFEVCVFAFTIAMFHFCHNLATIERGYEALGGEMFVLLIPAVVWAVRKNGGK